jgi:hypothetical protein
MIGRIQEAISEGEQAVLLDPLSQISRASLAEAIGRGEITARDRLGAPFSAICSFWAF